MKIIDVAAAVIMQDGRFLITKRLKTSHLGHCWEFPGGKREANETFEQCVERECLEEIGVSVRPIKELHQMTHAYAQATLHLKFFSCEIISGDLKPIQCSELRWVLPAELSQFEFPEADRELVLRLSGENKLLA